jgi:hypothetical protein
MKNQLHPSIMKIVNYQNCDVPPPQGLSLGMAGQRGFNISVTKTAAAAPCFGAAAFILSGGWEHQPPSW